MPISRRTILKTGAATVASAGISRWAHAAEPLRVAGYGGEFGQIYKSTVIEPFEKKFGVKVIFDESGLATAQFAKLRAGKGDGGFDVAAEFTPELIITGSQEKLLAPITEKEVPNLKYTWSQTSLMMPPYGALRSIVKVVLMYHKDKIPKPDSWLDYWEAHKKYGPEIKGRIAGHGPQNYSLLLYPLLMAARVRGGDERNLAPAWELLKAVKPFFGPVLANSAAAVPYMENQQLWLLPYWSSRGGYYVERGFPYAMSTPKEGTMALALASAIPIGSQNKELAYKFVNFTLEPDVQKAFCTAYHSGPARGDIKDWPAAFAEQQITTVEEMNRTAFPDIEYLAGQRRKITDTWQDIMA